MDLIDAALVALVAVVLCWRRPRDRRFEARVFGRLGRGDSEVFARVDAGEPPRDAAEAEAREPYERLIAALRDLEPGDIEPPGQSR